MAKKRTLTAKQRRYFAPRRARRSKSSRGGFGRIGGAAKSLLPAVAFGYVYQRYQPMLNTLGGPALDILGDYRDEVTLYGLSWAAEKYVPIGFVKDVARVGKQIAPVLVGIQLAKNTGPTAIGNSGFYI